MSAQHVPHTPLWRKVVSLPRTRLGWWSVGLAAAFVANFIYIIYTNSPPTTVEVPQWMEIVVFFYRRVVLFCGLAGGLVGLIAVLRRHERSALVWLSMLLGLFALLFLFLMITGGGLVP